MLLSPFIYYIMRFLLVSILTYDTLGFIVSDQRNKASTNAKLLDYKRLVFSWIFVLSMISIFCKISLVPIIDDIVIICLIIFTIPFLNGSEKMKEFLFNENGLIKQFYNLTDLILTKIFPLRKSDPINESD